MTPRLVVGVAVVAHGRLLAARRTSPAEAAGRWELPGGKVEPGESPAEAAVREVREELGCAVTVTGTLDGADPSAGGTYLLPAFAAVFLGATTITPGRFNPWGTFIAVYFLGTGIAGLQLLGLASWIQPVFYGGALVIAVAFSQVMRGRQALKIEG